MEQLEKIIDYLLPSAVPAPTRKERPLKFRITMQVLVAGESEPHLATYGYHDLATARKCYRNILLAFYRCRELEIYKICLNHQAYQAWEAPIFMESVSSM